MSKYESLYNTKTAKPFDKKIKILAAKYAPCSKTYPPPQKKRNK